MNSSKPVHHLKIGELFVCQKPMLISTVLGSCVSVCLFHPSTQTGGMIHFAHALPISDHGQAKDFRYGDIAIPALIQKLEQKSKAPCTEFVAKIIGGANSEATKNSGYNIGEENVKLARLMLKQFKIPVIGESVGGVKGRKARFHSDTGQLQMAFIEPQADAVSSNKPRRKVLVVDDSKTVRDVLKKIIERDPELEIVGFAEDAFKAAVLVKKVNPDVITLDMQMPKMSGLEWLGKLLPAQPIPVVLISSLQLEEGNDIFKALELGAVDYIQKPNFHEIETAGPLICEKVKDASFAKVIRLETKPETRRIIKTYSSPEEYGSKAMLVIGASTGGTEAIKQLLCSLPADIPPTLVVQHIPPTFSKAFAMRLNEICEFEVKEAAHGDEVLPGRVLIAPGGKQMKLRRSQGGLFVEINDDPPMNRHKPSVDYLFHSVAPIAGKNTVGVILTGMGSDGANGLLNLRKSGAFTMAQDEASCVVYGMPRVAVEIGAVELTVPLGDMSQVILEKIKKNELAS